MKAIKTIYADGAFNHRLESGHLSIPLSEVEYRTILSEVGKECEVETLRTRIIDLNNCSTLTQSRWANRIVRYYAANKKDINDLEKQKIIMKRNLSLLNKDLNELKKLSNIK